MHQATSPRSDMRRAHTANARRCNVWRAQPSTHRRLPATHPAPLLACVNKFHPLDVRSLSPPIKTPNAHGNQQHPPRPRHGQMQMHSLDVALHEWRNIMRRRACEWVAQIYAHGSAELRDCSHNAQQFAGALHTAAKRATLPTLKAQRSSSSRPSSSSSSMLSSSSDVLNVREYIFRRF